MEIGKFFENIFVTYSNFMWGTPLVILLMGGGIFFFFYSGFVPLRYFRHAIDVLRGKHDNPDDKGEINHYQALSTHLAATVGMGNISGVALALIYGGPGAIFWMWISAFFGMATKFYSCSLAIHYRGKDSLGHLQGGPMYVIREGLSRNWHWLASLFCIVGMIGVLPIFQANQLTELLADVIVAPLGYEQSLLTNSITGLFFTVIVAFVVVGGIKRIGVVAGKLVPFMVVLYFITVIIIALMNYKNVPGIFGSILSDAWSGKAVAGGIMGALLIGVQRAAFSNEAGIGTAPMAHGAAKTNNAIHEGLVAMLGPAIDTLIVCTLTAIALLSTGVWEPYVGKEDIKGISVTLEAFEIGIPFGGYILTLCAFTFAITSLFSLSYYGEKCYGYLFGAKRKAQYRILYVGSIILGSVASLKAIISLIDGMYATMAIPTMLSAIILAPKVKKLSNEYFSKLKASRLKR